MLKAVSILYGLDSENNTFIINRCEKIIADLYKETDQPEKAGLYYKKALEGQEQYYEEHGTDGTLRDLIVCLDKIGDNKYEMGFYDEAHVYRLRALDMFEQYVKMDPSWIERRSYYFEKAKPGE